MDDLESHPPDLSLTGVRRLYERAVEHFDAGEFGKAETCLERLVDREPRHGHAYWYLARVKEHQGDTDQALFFWKTCALLNDGRQDWVDGVYSRLVEYYFKNEKFDEMYQFLSQAATRDPGCRSVQKQLAAAAEKLGDKAAAIEHLTRCLTMGGDEEFQWEVQDRLMNLCLEAGDLETLREVGKKILATDSQSARAHYLLSRYYEKRGQLEKALVHLRKSARGRGSERMGEISVELAALYKKAGRPRDAITTLDAAGLLDDVHPFALWLSAECYEEMGDAPAALATWRRAAEAFGPASREGREAFFAYTESLLDLGREEEAKTHLERSPAAIRQTERARRYLAEANERLGKLEMARRLWEELLDVYPGQSRERIVPILSLTRILLAEGEAESALQILEGEDLASLKNADLYAIKAEVHEDLGQEEKALLCWEKAELIVRHDRRRAFDIKLTRAELLLKLSMPHQAAELLLTTSARHGREERYYGLLGQSLAEVGDHERAIDVWQRLVDSPRSRLRREGLGQLARLYRDLGQLDLAAECYERLIGEGHDMKSGLMGLAEIHEERGRFDKAHGLWDALAEMYESSHALSVRARARAQNAREIERSTTASAKAPASSSPRHS